MSYTLEVLLDLGELKQCEALVIGVVDASELGEYIHVEIKKVVAYLPAAKGHATHDWDVTHLVNEYTMNNYRELIEKQYEHARYNSVKPMDYIRDDGA